MAIFIGYHGTDRTSAEAILEEKTFLPSGTWQDWLGRGVYFFEFDPHQAFMITKARKRCSKDKIVVLKSQILSENFLDLLTDDDRTFMEDFAKELETKIKEKEAEIGKWKHQEGFILDALYKIDPFDLVRAAYHVPRKHTYFRCDYETAALYNFYATSEVDETSLHKACTKSVGFFAVWALETKVPKNISRCICQLIWLRSSCGLAFWYFAKCLSRYGSIFRLL